MEPRKLTWLEYRAARESLTKRQLAWLGAKANWERMTPWAVMQDWSVPEDAQLNEDGTWAIDSAGDVGFRMDP